MVELVLVAFGVYALYVLFRYYCGAWGSGAACEYMGWLFSTRFSVFSYFGVLVTALSLRSSCALAHRLQVARHHLRGFRHFRTSL